MKNILILLFFISLSGFSQNRYALDTLKKQIMWHGYAVGGGHEGTLNLLSGSLTVEKQKITGGDFVIDMQSLKGTDQKSEQGNKDLSDHLKSDDFFSAALFPTARFSIVQVKSLNDPESADRFSVSGSLTIKGITQPITFPASIKIDPEQVKVMADITINRTHWNIRHSSKSFFTDLKEGVISDDIMISIDLRLKPVD